MRQQGARFDRDRDTLSRLPSAADRAAATRLSRPSERERDSNRLAYVPDRLRPSPTAPANVRPSPTLPSRISPPERNKPSILSNHRPSPSRYPDGRYTVYNPPKHHGGHHPNHRPHYDRHDHHRHDRYHSPSRFSFGLVIGSGWYTPGWYGSSWNTYYPASYTSFGWSGRNWLFSFNTYSTPYYDSWSYGGWGYSGVYSSCWRSGWYGGYSYIYNPWPAYRSTYFYDPVPVVTHTETIYVTQPSTTTVIYEQPPYAQPEAGSASLWNDAPAVEQIDTATIGCLCACRCNGRHACICDYPCGAEYAMHTEDFDLGLAYQSYSDVLDPETIWQSYIGLDRWTQSVETFYADSSFAQ